MEVNKTFSNQGIIFNDLKLYAFKKMRTYFKSI